MKFILILFLFTYSLSQIVFPFKIRENNDIRYSTPINETKVEIDKYLYHILNEFEFISEIEIGDPRQKVEAIFKFFDNYLAIISHTTSTDPYFYNESSTYKELKEKDPDCNLQVLNPFTISEILYLKNKFYDNLDDFIKSKDEIKHEFVIIFSKILPKINYGNTGTKYYSANALNIGLLININYQKDHGMYNPFLNEIQENGFIKNKTHFLYFFEKYGQNLNYKSASNMANSPEYKGLIVFGKYPHELLPEIYDIENLSFSDTFLVTYEYSDTVEIDWGVQFSKVYLEYSDNKIKNFDIYRGIFDFNVEYILPPYQFYDKIEDFFQNLDDICFTVEKVRNFNGDGKIHRMIYCKYDEFKKDYLETFPKLVFTLNDYNETFEFTYKDLFRPVYNNKYYLCLLFMRRVSGKGDMSDPPTWYLGRLFMQKYQFIFDAENKRVGYYKTFFKDIDKDSTEKTDEIKTDDIKTDDTDKTKSDIIQSDNVNNTDVISDEPNDDKKKKKMNDIILIVVFSVVSAGIIVAAIVIFCKCMKNKEKRKKRANELIDEADYNNDVNNNEDKAIN